MYVYRYIYVCVYITYMILHIIRHSAEEQAQYRRSLDGWLHENQPPPRPETAPGGPKGAQGAPYY